MSWYSLQPASLEDGDTLGFLRLVANGTTPLQWDLVNQGNNELADSTGQVVECSYVGGQLSVLPLPEPILLSSSLAFCQGDSVTLSIQDASGAFPQGWVYEWYRDGLLLSGVVGVQHIALQGGRYRVRVTNADGCSRLTSEVEVLVNLPSNTTLNEVICAPSSFIVGGQGFQSAGVYQVNLTNYFGCDSLITLNLTVNEPSASTMSQAICAPNGYSFNGQWLTTTGVYLDTLINGLGCDSVVTLDLTVNQPSQIAIFDTLCAPNCYVVDGQTFCASGSYTVTLTNVLGCDSVITLNLTVNNCNRITGVLRYKNNAQTPMSRSYVKLTDFNGNVVAGDSTDLGGNFDLSGYPSGSYTLSGASSIQWGGVNATDGVLIQRSYSTILPLTGLNLLAADVNASG
ncbi:hypothetical protein EBZ35_08270, partial [bacterium]|nr:hypothetical protein [bacterium]